VPNEDSKCVQCKIARRNWQDGVALSGRGVRGYRGRREKVHIGRSCSNRDGDARSGDYCW